MAGLDRLKKLVSWLSGRVMLDIFKAPMIGHRVLLYLGMYVRYMYVSATPHVDKGVIHRQ